MSRAATTIRSRRGRLLFHAMVEKDDAIGDVFFEPVAGQALSPRSPVMMAVTPFFNQPKRR